MGTLTDLGYKLTDGANQIDQAIIRALTYPDASDGSVGQVPTIGAGGIEWETPTGGVSSFNGRTGAITPQSGDYTASDVGAVPVYGMGKNLFDNWYFIGGGSQQGGGQFPINQRGGYIGISGKTYFSDSALTTIAGTFSDYTTVYQTVIATDYVSFRLAADSADTFYAAIGDVVPGYKTTAATTKIDRWRQLQNHVSVLTDSGVRVICKGTSNRGFQQRIEQISGLLGKTVTLSLLITGCNNPETNTVACTQLGTSSAQQAGMGLISWTYEVTSDTQGFFVVGNGDYIDVAAMKLELGDTQTLAHNVGTEVNPQWVLNDPLPNFQQELAKCQRHLWVINGTAQTQQFALGISNSETAMRAFFFPPVPMRVTPTISVELGRVPLKVRSGATSGISVSSVSIVSTSSSNVLIYCNVEATGLQAGAASSLYKNSSETCSILFSAEL